MKDNLFEEKIIHSFDGLSIEEMDELLKVSGRLAAAAKILGDKESEALAKQLREEATKIRMLRRNLEEKYLSGERSDHKWQ